MMQPTLGAAVLFERRCVKRDGAIGALTQGALGGRGKSIPAVAAARIAAR